jgi:hypothetical protein
VPARVDDAETPEIEPKWERPEPSDGLGMVVTRSQTERPAADHSGDWGIGVPRIEFDRRPKRVADSEADEGADRTILKGNWPSELEPFRIALFDPRHCHAGDPGEGGKP